MTKKKKKIRREPWGPLWMLQAQLIGFTSYKGRKLGLTIIGTAGEYLLLALETTATAPEEVLGEHAHESLGTYPTVSAAMTAAAAYAKKWWRSQSKKTAGPWCGCVEIEE
jgi:hypothetical protein